MPKAARVGLLLVALALIVGGRLALTYPDQTTQLLALRVGRTLMCARSDVFPCGTVFGYGVFLIGALLAALAIGRPADRLVIAPGPPHAADLTPRVRRDAGIFVASAGVLAIAAAAVATQLGPWPLVLLIAASLAGLAGMLLLDRGRGSRLGNPLTRTEWVALLAVVALDLVLVAHDLASWRWSGTPDETDFFGVAKSIALGLSERALLSEHGVFEFHPVLSSLYQSLFMRVFGINVFAWRLSSAVALVGSLPFLYLFARELWSRRAAWMATIFLGTAQLAIGFAHYGYNNIQVIPVITAALALMVWAQRHGSLAGYYLAGSVAGWGFYTYYTARFGVPVLLLLAWHLGDFSLAKESRRRMLALGLGVGLAALPVLVRLPDAVHNVLRVAEVPGEATSHPLGRALLDWFLSVVYGIWYRGPSHFQWNPVVDPFSGSLAIIGLWMSLGAIWRRGAAGFVATAYLLSALVLGVTSPHFRPPLTRLLFLTPFTALLAALALEGLLQRLREMTATASLAVTLVAASVVWNVAELHVNITQRYHGCGNGTTSELLRVVRTLPATTNIFYVQRGDTDMVAVDLVLDEYGLKESFTYLRPFNERARTTLATAQPPLAVFYNLSDAAEIAALRGLLSERFPDAAWRDTDAGQPWDVPYLIVSPPGT